MNRIRTIATAGIVAGSVALAAAFISPGGVGAEFVDAAEASASITVADHFKDLPESRCRIILHHTGRGFDFGNHDDHDPFDIWKFGTDRGDGTFGATFDFTISAPGADWIDVTWDVSTDGDLHYSPATDTHSPSGSVTFWWETPRSGHHLKGKAFITFSCTPHYKKHHENHSGPGSMSLASADDLKGSGSDSESHVSTDEAYTSDPPETFSIEAVLDVPAEHQADRSCDSTTTTSTALDTTPIAAGRDGCAPSGQSGIDCAPDSADSSDPAACPPEDESADITTGSSSAETQESTSSGTSDSDATGASEDSSSNITGSGPADLPAADPPPDSR